MSSTISHRKIAASIRDAGTGDVHYALFEEAGERNVCPRTLRWNAVEFGSAATCMTTVIERASNCEGGMLTAESGPIPTATYIRQWRAALASALALPAYQTTMRRSHGHGSLSAAQIMHAEHIAAQIMFGLTPVEDELSVNLGRPGAVDFMARLAVSDEGSIPPSHWISQWNVDQNSHGEAYVPSEVAKDGDVGVRVFKFAAPQSADAAACFVLVRAVKAQDVDYPRALISEFIRRDGVEAELSRPSSVEYEMRQFKKKLETAPLLRPEFQVSVMACGPGAQYGFDAFTALCQKLKVSPRVRGETTIGALAQAKAISDFCHLGNSQREFVSLFPPEMKGCVKPVHQPTHFRL